VIALLDPPSQESNRSSALAVFEPPSEPATLALRESVTSEPPAQSVPMVALYIRENF